MPFRFPVKFDLPQHVHINARVIRDQFKRLQYNEHEVTRNALRYIARNTELPARARLEAQLQLASMPKYTSYSQIRDRCVASGNSKSVIPDFKLNRTTFRERARHGLIPGVKVASW
ncbi:40S ribosomal protein mrp2, mitochondrial [Scheffersomyces spartinae]|uniref:37S ribosomal protein MRP2, mitochondrial n=1 Tax=Scheffersomyces spartinae TaxID=45513 RepID=A0A9P7VAA9_9ASCO|nr:40S ribosomal protein mrp2, mitochondrial [Scheffersomyces spartinae]KAG7194105.1 40S ribosomal protein mrp2, mitochondrial [Scheffersomyces spartinae]